MAKAVIIDRGWQRIKSDIAELRNQGVKVGIRSTAGSQDGVRIVDYGVWNEFGTEDGRIPARPFMRRTADQSKNYLPRFAKYLTERLLAKKININQLMMQLGMFYQAKIRETIRSSPSWAKPNAPATIKKKKSSVPLIDHGMLHGAIDYERTKL